MQLAEKMLIGDGWLATYTAECITAKLWLCGGLLEKKKERRWKMQKRAIKTKCATQSGHLISITNQLETT